MVATKPVGVAGDRDRSRGVRVISVTVLALSLLTVAHSSPSVAATPLVKGCGSTTASSSTMTLNVDGHSRTVIVHLPTSYTSKTKIALVLNLHGSGSTAHAQEKFTGMDDTADADDFIVAYPQGLIPDGAGFDWNVPGVALFGGRAVPAGSANDVKFLTSLVGILERDYCVNPKEVYATGFSGGAREASQLACDESSVFAAVAPVSGLRRPSPCPTARAVPIISFHGSVDDVDPFAGHGQTYWTYSVTTAAKDWARQDKCATKPATSTPVSTVTLTTFSRCEGNATVELYEVAGEGHEWPGGPTLPTKYTAFLGPQSNAVSANALIWSFFEAHPLA
jgi:polyhydroxybutyrate depolymerase